MPPHRPGPKGKGSDALRRAAARMMGIASENTEHSILTRAQDRLIQHWSEHPWNFLTGRDVDKDRTQIIWTKDERDKIKPIKPFPAHLLYIQVYISILFDPDEDFILADKCRQMYLTTATLLYMLWEIIFLPGRRWIHSKSTEDEAKEHIRDKIRFPVSMLPQWFRDWCGFDGPEHRIDCKRTGSYILGVAQNVAEREARGGTASGLVIDEAAFQDKFTDMVAAALPMAAKIVGITTPNPRALKFKEYLDDHMVMDYISGETFAGKGHIGDLLDQAMGLKYKPKRYPKIPGMSVHKTRRGVCVIHLDYWADPAKDANWIAKAREKAPSESHFRAEYMRDWDTSPGDAFYTVFQMGRDRYIRPLRNLIAGPVYRGWDFGRRTPALVWLQYSPTSGRVWVIREIMPRGFDIYSFRNLVLYLSGERPRSFLDRFPLALQWLQDMEEDQDTPEILRRTPWFPINPRNPIQFLDYAGHEAHQSGDAVQGKEQTRAQILGAEGIVLQVNYTTTKAKSDQFRRLLGNLPDGNPGILFDPACKILIKGFGGGITYAKGTSLNPFPDEPAKDGYFDNLHEACGYVVVNALPMVETQPPQPSQIVGYDGSRRPIIYNPAEAHNTILEADSWAPED